MKSINYFFLAFVLFVGMICFMLAEKPVYGIIIGLIGFVSGIVSLLKTLKQDAYNIPKTKN